MATWNLVNADNPALARTAIDTLAEKPAAYFNASLLADGALPLTGTLDSGHPYEVTHSSSSGFDIVDGAIKTDVSLAYLNFGPLEGHIREFDLEIMWVDDSEAADDTAVIIVADGPFANDYPTSYANAGAHILINRTTMTFQKRTAVGPPSTQRTHTYTTALAYDVKHRFRLLWDGATATMITPGGTTVPIPADADIVSWWGAYGCVELLGAASGRNKCFVRSFSATAQPAVPKASPPPSRLLGAMQTSGANVSTAITTSLSAKLFGLSIPIPPSRRVFITGSVWLDLLIPVARAATSLALGVYPAGVIGYGKLTTISLGYTQANASVDAAAHDDRMGTMGTYTHGQLIPFSLDLTLDPAFVIGDTQDFQVKMQAAAAGQWTFIDSGGDSGFAGIRRSSMMIFEIPA